MKMKRRNFLKATIGAIAALFAPKVVAGVSQAKNSMPGIVLPDKSPPANGHNSTTDRPAKKKLIIGMSEEDFGFRPYPCDVDGYYKPIFDHNGLALDRSEIEFNDKAYGCVSLDARGNHMPFSTCSLKHYQA